MVSAISGTRTPTPAFPVVPAPRHNSMEHNASCAATLIKKHRFGTTKRNNAWPVPKTLPSSSGNTGRQKNAARRYALPQSHTEITTFTSACRVFNCGEEVQCTSTPAPRAAYRSARTSSLRKTTVSCAPPATSCIQISRIGTLPPGTASVSVKKTTMAENAYPVIGTTRHTGTRLRESVRSVRGISAGTRTREPV